MDVLAAAFTEVPALNEPEMQRMANMAAHTPQLQRAMEPFALSGVCRDVGPRGADLAEASAEPDMARIVGAMRTVLKPAETRLSWVAYP